MSEEVFRIVESWLSVAEEDLTISKRELSYIDHEIFPRTVFFHAHQAVEKYLKAFLMYHSCSIRKTHDLEYLKVLCGQLDATFDDLNLDVLMEYSAEIRYPDEACPTVEEAKSAYKTAKSVREFILSKIKIDKDKKEAN